jgi:PAS domain S-box-containing protein
MIEGDFEIENALSADEAFEKLSTRQFDIIISDYEMPQKNGLQLLVDLREQKNETPFILFTGKGREEIAIKALNLGADGYFNKQGSPETVYGELIHGINLAVTRRKAEQEILAQRNTAERYLNVVGNIVIALNLEGKITLLNKKAYEILGYDEGELLGKDWVNTCLPSECQKKLRAVLSLCIQGKALIPTHYENPVVTKKGEIKIISWHNTELRDNSGQLIGTLSSGEDITEQKKAEKILRESEEKYRDLANSLPDIVFETDISGTLLYVNDRAFEIAGYTVEDFKKGLNVIQFLVPEEQDRAKENIKGLLSGGKYVPDEYKFVRKNGTYFPALITAMPRICNNKVVGLRGFILDISERKKSDEQLENSKNHFRNLIDSVLSGIIVVDGETREIIDANPAALGLMGAKRDDVLGKHCHEFICPNEIGNCPIIDKGQTIDKAEKVLLTKEGKRLPVLKSVVKVEQNGRTLLVENYIDISDRKKAELSLLENQKHLKLMNEKLNVVGAMTRHDIRNKLTSVTGNTYLLKKKHANQTDIIDGLSRIENAVKEAMKIFEFARLYEQLGVEELKYVDVEQTLNEALALFSNLTFKTINDCHGLSLFADSFLRQLFYNFIDNTRKYGKKTTVLKVYYEKDESGELRLIFEDDGVGITEENKLKLFKEGFSTGGSTGFGLFLSKKMIDTYGWQIQEIGEASRGAKIMLSVPNQNATGIRNFIFKP